MNVFTTIMIVFFIIGMVVDVAVFKELGVLCRSTEDFKKLNFGKKVLTVVGMIVVEAIIMLFFLCGILVLLAL